MGPSDDAAADFEKELAKTMIDSAAESRKVDRKTAMALWDSAVTSGVRKKKGEDVDDDGDVVGGDSARTDDDTMKFTVLSKRGNKQQVSLLFLCFNLYVLMANILVDATAWHSYDLDAGHAHSFSSIAR